MRLTRAAACRSLVGCVLVLSLTAPAFARGRVATVLELAAQQKNLSTFVAAVHAAGLDETLKAAGPITVFAPTDQAFAKMPAADREALLHSPARLRAMLLGGVVNDLVVMGTTDAITSGSISTAGGGTLAFALDGDRTTVGGAHIVQADIRADNGCITTLDKVLLP